MKKGGSIFGAYQVFNAENFSSHHAALKSTIARRDTQRRPKASLGFPGLSWGGIPWFCPRFFLTNQPPAVRHPLITSSAETHNLGSASIQGLRLPTASFLTLPSNKATSPYQPIFFCLSKSWAFLLTFVCEVLESLKKCPDMRNRVLHPCPAPVEAAPVGRGGVHNDRHA